MPVDDDQPQPDVEGSWRDNAACAGHPTSWWFPVIPQGTRYEPGPGETICETCQVRDECEQAGVSEPGGIWGGVLKPSRRVKRVP